MAALVANVVTTQVGNRSLQARNAQRSEVIRVLAEVGVLTGTGELVDHAVGEQVEAGTGSAFRATVTVNHVALVQPDETAVVADLLTTEHQRVATQGVSEHGGPGLVVDLASVLGVATVVAEVVATAVTVVAVTAAVEVAQVGLERLVVGDLEDVGGTQEVLLVEVFQVRVVVLQGQVWSELVVQAAVAELVAVGSGASDRQASTVARRTAHGVSQLTGVDGQVVDFLRLDSATLEGLRQHTAIVRD